MLRSLHWPKPGSEPGFSSALFSDWELVLSKWGGAYCRKGPLSVLDWKVRLRLKVNYVQRFLEIQHGSID